MNYIEARALKWIAAAMGLHQSEIAFSNNTSPDFMTPDGQGFEIKHYMSCSRRIQIHPKQWKSLLKIPRCFILVFGELDHPDAIIPMAELPIGTKRWGRFGIDSQEPNPRSIPREEYLENLRKKKEAAAMATAA